MPTDPKNSEGGPLIWKPISSDYYRFQESMTPKQTAVSTAAARRRKPDISIADLFLFGRVARHCRDNRVGAQKRAASEIGVGEDVVSEAIKRLERGMKRKLIVSTISKEGSDNQRARRRGSLTPFGRLFAENCWLIERFWIRLATVGMVEPLECLYYLRAELAMWKFADAAVNRPEEWEKIKFLLEPKNSIPDILGHEIWITPPSNAEEIEIRLQKTENQLKKEYGSDHPIWDLVEEKRIQRKFRKRTG